MKNFFYFLLGFVIVSAFMLSSAFAGKHFFKSESSVTPQAGVWANSTGIEYNNDNGLWIYQNNPVLTTTAGYKYLSVAVATCEGAGLWSSVSIYPSVRVIPSVTFDGIQLPTLSLASIQAAYPACPLPPCDPPNAVNPLGQCVPCPSGVFLVTGYCVPSCDYSNAYVPGELYNPPGGTGTCVMPPCGPGQTTNSEGRCIPNCEEGKKLDAVNGTCVLDCYYGTHEENGQCVNDCMPGFMVDAETGSCIEEHGCLSGEDMCHGLCMSQCLPGEARNPKDCTCIAPAPDCPFGQHEENGVCVATPVSCPPGSHFDQTTHTCKQDPLDQEEDKTIVTNPDGTITETITRTVTISNGSGGTITGTTTTVTNTNPGTGNSNSNTTVSPPSIDKYESPEHKLNWEGWNSQAKRFANEGPLKVLKVIQGYIQSLDVEPEAPSFDFIVWGHHFNVNLSAFDPLAQACRFFLGLSMTIGFGWFIYRLFGVA